MFKWATFQEILLPSSGNVNYYVAKILTNELTQTHHFYVVKVDCLFTFICLIILISHIAQLFLIRKFCCFPKGPHISFK